MTARLKWAEIVAVLAAAFLSGMLLLVQPTHSLATFTVGLVTLGMVSWIAWQDMLDFTIPDGPLIAISLVGAAGRIGMADGSLSDALILVVIDGCVCGGALFFIREVFFRLRGLEGMGFGDVKLAAAAGVLLGIVGFSWAIFLASVAGILFVLSATLLRPKTRHDKLPFGSFLAPMCWCVWLFGT